MKVFKGKSVDPFLIGALLLAAFLNIYGIWQDQNANAYYTAAVTSMLQSFHNFFFASFDPGGFVTVDKPPVAFWVQTIFASVFGVQGWSVILPQALAGVGSVLLIYDLVKPSFGKLAARLAALVAACTPIAVAVSRTNNVDSLLVFTLLTATWMLFKGVRTQKWVWLIAAFAVIGVAFNIKMLQAYMVLPAFYLYYLLAYNVNLKKKLTVLVAATVALLMVSLSWPLIVDSIPAENRPYIGSSQTNSVLELAFGYNGISRLTGDRGRGGVNPTQDQMPPDDGKGAVGRQGDDGGSPGDAGGKQGDGGGSPGGGGMFNTGTVGPLRLFQSQLSGQISWLLPFALLAAFGLLMGIRRKRVLTDKQKESLFWLAWLLPMMAFFSVAEFFHQYYLIMLAPAIAALTGAGWVELWSFNRNHDGWKKWLLPMGILGTTLFQLYILLPYRVQIGLGLPIVVGVVGSGISLYLCMPQFKRTSKPGLQTSIKAAALGGILILLVAPLYWATTPILYGGNSMLPAAGPQSSAGMPGQSLGQGRTQFQNPTQEASNENQAENLAQKDQTLNQTQTQTQTQDITQGSMPNQPQGQGQGQPQETIDTKLLAFLTANNTGEKFLFATTNAGTAEAYIIQTGQAVMAMGGFSGSDPILTVDKLKQMIANKEIKYFLSSSGGPGGGNSDVQTWISQNGKVVPQSIWQSSTTDSSGLGMGRNGAATLYEINP
ncbi:hypothetical protein UF75_5247 [Desulfosporosinus sp. I2]|uniref:glycosyltransferase family 39 protein n=1 Tax=Desulfosporosinus sp. I2 TaxID=1617025 RepID=UPI0005EF1167|nr:glycosyltransferase family 39 protein [Desulfosporosinus sp. I2]KJR44368.1 hypothetical protein UF75_5247 [Desulfosporosinus sp. I2]